MAVIINEVEHVVTGETPRGDETRAAEPGGGAPSPARLEVDVLGAIRREASRRARLWAD